MNFINKINFIILTWAIDAVERDEDPKNELIDFAVGGQAVVEGVMMRAPNNITIAVRKPDGTITVRKKHYRTLTQRFPVLNFPILRGVINLFEMMIVGTDAINYSAGESLDETPKDEQAKKTGFARAFEISLFVISFVVAMALSLTLFKLVPLGITTFLQTKFTTIADNFMLFNVIDGLLKMTIFLSYIYILGLIPSFRRIFQYHGAEHKSIRTYEAHQKLAPENAKPMSRFHPRCGTSFILIVFVISIIFYTFIPKQPDFWMNFAVRLAVLPFIAGISYEYLKFSAKHTDKAFVRAMIAPGLWFQRLTTKEPDAKQLEVGLLSLKDSLEMERVGA